MEELKQKKEPKYHYSPKGRGWALYELNNDGNYTKIDQHWDKEVIRRKCYELNGWKYKEDVSKIGGES